MSTSIGIVKWFGGFNRQKNKENDFGFVEDIAGFDVYIHENDWAESTSPVEGTLITYSLEDNKAKQTWKAKNASLLHSKKVSLDQLLEWLSISDSNKVFYSKYHTSLNSIEDDSFFDYSKEELVACLNNKGRDVFFEILSIIMPIYRVNFQKFFDEKIIDPLIDMKWRDFPDKNFIKNNEAAIAQQLLAMEKQTAKELIVTNINEVNVSLFQRLIDLNVLDPLIDMKWRDFPDKNFIKNNEEAIAQQLLTMDKQAAKTLFFSNLSQVNETLFQRIFHLNALNLLADMKWSHFPDKNFIKNNEAAIAQQLLAMGKQTAKELIVTNINEVNVSLFQRLIDLNVLDPLIDIKWRDFPDKNFIKNNEEAIAQQLLTMDKQAAKTLFFSNFSQVNETLFQRIFHLNALNLLADMKWSHFPGIKFVQANEEAIAQQLLAMEKQTAKELIVTNIREVNVSLFQRLYDLNVLDPIVDLEWKKFSYKSFIKNNEAAIAQQLLAMDKKIAKELIVANFSEVSGSLFKRFYDLNILEPLVDMKWRDFPDKSFIKNNEEAIAQQLLAMDNKIAKELIFTNFSEVSGSLFKRFYDLNILEPLVDMKWRDFPDKNFIIENEEAIAQQLLAMDKKMAKELIFTNFSEVSESLFKRFYDLNILDPLVDMKWRDFPDKSFIKNNEAAIAQQLLAMDNKIAKTLIFSNYSEVRFSLFERFVDSKVLNPIVDFLWRDLPYKNFVINNEKEIAKQLLAMPLEESSKIIESNFNLLTPSLLILASFSGMITDFSLKENALDDAARFIESVYLNNNSFPEYFQSYIKEHVTPNIGVFNAPVFGKVFLFYQFKKYLYEKNIKLVALYDNYFYLQSRFDVFVLKGIFSLVMADNSLEQVYDIFLGELWVAINSGQLNPSTQVAEILAIFPSCGSFVHSGLSCEAIYWKKQNKFLCRGRPCSSPKVLGCAGADYFKFSIYDWFEHYGIRYLAEGEPSNRDFPIKLAGYLNRLREIYEVLHCHSCQSLMLPNMRYARTEHIVIERGEFVKKDMAPAYRLTVFKCPNAHCIEHGRGHYINHCLESTCYELIDDRVCTQQCDAGLYICRGCSSCCSDHAKSNPNGLCPDCGSALLLYQTDESRGMYGGNKRFSQCSNQYCGFNVPSDRLNKRFYLDSCRPDRYVKSYS